MDKNGKQWDPRFQSKLEMRIPCVVLVVPGESVPGVWVAHCLTIDVAAQGSTPAQALGLLQDSVFIAIGDDITSHFDVSGRRAPPEEWNLLGWAMLGEETTLSQAMRDPRYDGKAAVMRTAFGLALSIQNTVEFMMDRGVWTYVDDRYVAGATVTG